MSHQGRFERRAVSRWGMILLSKLCRIGTLTYPEHLQLGRCERAVPLISSQHVTADIEPRHLRRTVDHQIHDGQSELEHQRRPVAVAEVQQAADVVLAGGVGRDQQVLLVQVTVQHTWPGEVGVLMRRPVCGYRQFTP